MRFVAKRSIHSREELTALSPREHEQFVSGAGAIVGCDTLDEILAWSDRELCGWWKVELLDDASDAVRFEGWILNGGDDDGVLFEVGAPQHNGIGISQDSVSDMHEERDELCREVQAAWNAFERPAFKEWARPGK